MTNLKPGDTPIIFERSTVNGADNMQHLLPVQPWEFPKSTWLQRRNESRLEQIHKEQNQEEK